MKKLIVFIAAVAALFFIFAFVLFGSSLVEMITTISPAYIVLMITAALIVASFLFGLITGDYSWVDRMWSTAPIFYAWVYAVRGWFDPRLFIAAVLVTLWGLRLTFNFARRGGYTGMEDYRWPILQQKIKTPVLWQLFNFGFISLFQISLFFLFTSPIYRIYLQPGVAPSAGFYITAVLFIMLLIFETIADQQQWNFHKIKTQVKKGSFSGDSPDAGLSPRMTAFMKDAQDGFCQSGLFRISRHPNYFGEVSIWWVFFIMGSLHAGSFIHWSISGPLLLTLVFFGSTRFTEAITSAKYPLYAQFQQRTSAVIPWFPKKSVSDEEGDRVTG